MGVKVVADSHALVYYLVDPERLSNPALATLHSQPCSKPRTPTA